MSLFAWIVVGLICGFIRSKIVDKRGKGILRDIVLGVAGAVAGGILFDLFGPSGATGFNLWGVLLAVSGSIALLVGYHAIRHS